MEQLIRKLQKEIKEEGGLFDEGEVFAERDAFPFIPEPLLHYEHPLRATRKRSRKAVLFLKKLIRRCIRFLIVPILDEQSGFNYSVKAEISRLGQQLLQQEDRIRQLEAKSGGQENRSRKPETGSKEQENRSRKLETGRNKPGTGPGNWRDRERNHLK